MARAGQSHAIDLFAVKDPEAAGRQTPGVRGLGHVAFRVESEEALRDAYATLGRHGVEVTRSIDYVSQKSIYFQVPDGYTLVSYYESPVALASWDWGRNAQDAPSWFY